MFKNKKSKIELEPIKFERNNDSGKKIIQKKDRKN